MDTGPPVYSTKNAGIGIHHIFPFSLLFICENIAKGICQIYHYMAKITESLWQYIDSDIGSETSTEHNKGAFIIYD